MKYGAAVDNDLKQSNTSWRAGALYLFDNGLAPFVSYAESFEPVAGSDRLGRTYEPSTAEQWEAGLKFNPDGGRTNGSVTAYRILKDNVLTRDPNGSAYDQIQAGQVRSQGVELEVSSRLTDSFKVDASYTRQDVEVTRDNSGLEGKTPVWVPEQMASLWLTYDIYAGLLNGLSINGGVRYLGEAEVDALNSDEVPDVTLVDLGLSYDLGVAAQNLSGATLRMSVSNLFDERYYSCYDTLNCWFGAERSLQTSVRYDF
ncbi:TonB-dependent receptor [Halopseudomonas pachastrellae]|nr:TonB-dependent receptor [Halopseudomonas pachastrellae]